MTEVLQTLASAKQGRIWIAVAVVFLCGLLVGIVATKAYDDYQQQQKWENGLAGLKPRVMKHLTRELHLTANQQRAIEPILTQAERDLLRLRIAQQPQVDMTVVKTTEALKLPLTPQQQSKLDELTGKLQRRWDSDREYVRGLQ
jgi:Spy/CpxP family protein refolding chaperone